MGVASVIARVGFQYKRRQFTSVHRLLVAEQCHEYRDILIHILLLVGMWIRLSTPPPDRGSSLPQMRQRVYRVSWCEWTADAPKLLS